MTDLLDGKIIVNGQVIGTQNVQFQIGKIESGGIGVQVNNYDTAKAQNIPVAPAVSSDKQNEQPSAQTPPTKTPNSRRRRAKNPVLTNATFIYPYEKTDAVRIVRFYQQLIKGKLIDEQTNVEDFRSLFSGKDVAFKIKWIGTPSFLAQLINALEKKAFIRIPEGTGKWQIVQSHFVDKDSRAFTDLRNQHPSKKANLVIEALATFLDPTTDAQ